MTNLLQSGQQWLQSQLKSFASNLVTCVRGAAEIQVSATIGATTFRNQDAHGFEIRTQLRDYLIQASDYDFGSGQVEPVAGDLIRENGLTYEVNAPAGEPCFRYSDVFRTTLRIHTKIVADS